MSAESPSILRVVLGCCGLMLPVIGHGQSAGGRIAPSHSISFELGSSFGAALVDGAGLAQGDVDVIHTGATVGYRQQLAGSSTGLALELEYDHYRLALDSGTVPLPERAHSLAFEASARRPLSDRWSLLASLKPVLANTGAGLDGDGFGVTAGLLALRRQNDTLTWGVGVLYRSLAESDLRVLPAVGLEWRPAPAWRVDVGFPRTAVTFSATPRARWSLFATGQGGTFHLEEVTGAPVALRNTLLDYTEIRVGAGLEYAPRPTLVFAVSAGAIVHQEFDYFERGYKIEADNTPGFVRASVTWRY